MTTSIVAQSAPSTSKLVTTTTSASPTSTSTSVVVPNNAVLCAANDVSAAVTGSGVAAGSVGATITFRYSGKDPCILDGFPGIQTVNTAGGSRIVAVPALSGGDPNPVVLTAGHYAVALLQWSDGGGYVHPYCVDMGTLLITLPSGVGQVRLDFDQRGTLHVYTAVCSASVSDPPTVSVTAITAAPMS